MIKLLIESTICGRIEDTNEPGIICNFTYGK
jgi:hypothetical protein